MTLRILDLFSGIGGFSLGLERAGMKTVSFCEIDPFCRRVLERHWPDVPCHDDITTMEFSEGMVDVICGGFPCQDVSIAGKRAGLAGTRSGLYRELVRAICVVRPRVAIVENVAALLSDGMGTVLGDLAEIEDMSERWRFRHMENHTSITAELLGDPSFERSALGGYKHRGWWQGDGPKRGGSDL